MVVISLSNCPPRLRGDLTKWFSEIASGVYVGSVTARVRDSVWDRITREIGAGRAIMVFSARNEQRMDFRVHNSEWQPIDFDGLKLMLRPSAAYNAGGAAQAREWHSSASGIRAGRRASAHRAVPLPHSYVVVDVETTGLSAQEDRIIEIGAIKVKADEITEEYHALVSGVFHIPEEVIQLTGITNELLNEEGVDEKTAISGLLEFTRDATVICHNIRFDYGFIRAACKRSDLPMFKNIGIDTLGLAQKAITDIENYKLSTLAAYYSIDLKPSHRGIDDCKTIKLLYDKLIQ